jgi:hypothetical protein
MVAWFRRVREPRSANAQQPRLIASSRACVGLLATRTRRLAVSAGSPGPSPQHTNPGCRTRGRRDRRRRCVDRCSSNASTAATCAFPPASVTAVATRTRRRRVDHGLRLYWPDSLEALAFLAERTNRPFDTDRLAPYAGARVALVSEFSHRPPQGVRYPFRRRNNEMTTRKHPGHSVLA